MKRRTSRLLFTLLALCMVLALGAFPAAAAELEYTLSEDGKLVIAEGATSIPARAFVNNNTITSVTVPGSVTTIDNFAFQGCTNLETVTLSEGLISIGQHTFRGCTSLSSVNFPNSLQSIGLYAFYDSEKLSDVYLNAAVVRGDGAFSDKTTIHYTEDYFGIKDGVLTEYRGSGGNVVVPDGVIGISQNAFWNVQTLKSITLPAGIERVNLNNPAVETINFPDGSNKYTAIDLTCSNVKNLVIPGYVEELRVLGESMETIDIQNGAGSASLFCTASLKNVSLSGNIGEMTVTGLANLPPLETLTIPRGVKKLSVYCDDLKKLTLPDGVTSLWVVSDTITQLDVPDSVTSVTVFCDAITQLELPDNATHIDLICPNLKSVNVPANYKKTSGYGSLAYQARASGMFSSNIERVIFPKGSNDFRGLSFQDFAFIIEQTPYLEEIVNNPCKTLENHMKSNIAIRDSWVNHTIGAQTAKVTQLSNQITAGLKSDYDKTKAIARWVVNNIEYDYDYYYAGLKDYSDVPFNPDEVIDSGLAVCAGYARLTQALLEVQGIPCLYVLGMADGARGWEYHAWNLALVDGEWVWMDNTWGMDYFDVGTAYFSIDHIASGAAFFNNTGVQSSIVPKLDSSVQAELNQELKNDMFDSSKPDESDTPEEPDKPDEPDTPDTPDTDGDKDEKEKPSDWAQAEVSAAVAANLVPADLQSSYTANITREDFCRLMVTLVEQHSGMTISQFQSDKGLTSHDNFTDTSRAEVLAANALGIVNGRGNGIFAPKASITRQEAAAMLTRTAKLLGLKAGQSLNFSDTKDLPDWAVEGVAFVSGLTDPSSGNKVMQGTSSTKFSPLDNYTREQAILTTLRLFNCVA